jgi:hypothetical protein
VQKEDRTVRNKTTKTGQAVLSLFRNEAIETPDQRPAFLLCGRRSLQGRVFDGTYDTHEAEAGRYRDPADRGEDVGVQAGREGERAYEAGAAHKSGDLQHACSWRFQFNLDSKLSESAIFVVSAWMCSSLATPKRSFY